MIFKKKESTQELLGIEAITDYGISTKQGELVFFSVAPTHLDRIQVMTASSRQFYIVLRIRSEIRGDIYAHLGNVEKYIHEQGFTVHRADRQELRKLLAVYYGQSISVDPYPDYDGQQWE